MLISKYVKIKVFILKPVNFGDMMQRQLNEVISKNGESLRLPKRILDSQCFIMKSLNQRYVPFVEKVNTLFHQVESQYFILEMLAFFFLSDMKRKITVTQ